MDNLVSKLKLLSELLSLDFLSPQVALSRRLKLKKGGHSRAPYHRLMWAVPIYLLPVCLRSLHKPISGISIFHRGWKFSQLQTRVAAVTWRTRESVSGKEIIKCT